MGVITGMERLIIAAGMVASMVSAAMVILAQGILDPNAETWERFVGGSVLVVAAILIVRWAFTMIRTVQEVNTQERGQWADDRKAMLAQLKELSGMIATERLAWQDERSAILDQLDRAREHVAELSASLARERDLRLTLERAGVTDRRDAAPLALSPDESTTPPGDPRGGQGH